MRVVVNQELASMYNVAEESLRRVVVSVANHLHTHSFVRRRCNKSSRLRVKRRLACQLSREFSRLLRCCGPRKIAQLYHFIFRRCNFAVRCAAVFCMQQNISHLPVLTRLMTAFKENNGEYAYNLNCNLLYVSDALPLIKSRRCTALIISNE